MSPLLFEAGATLAALALIIGTAISFVTGSAPELGAATRTAIHPLLARIRAGSMLSRSEWADNSVLLAISFALAGVFDSFLSAALIGGLLWQSRPMIRRLTSEEHPLLALGHQLSADFVIGLYVPVAMASLLLGRIFTALALLMVIVALSWPAGGGAPSIGSGHRRLAWQPS